MNDNDEYLRDEQQQQQLQQQQEDHASYEASERHVERCATLTWRLDVSKPAETTRWLKSEMPQGLRP